MSKLTHDGLLILRIFAFLLMLTGHFIQYFWFDPYYLRLTLTRLAAPLYFYLHFYFLNQRIDQGRGGNIPYKWLGFELAVMILSIHTLSRFESTILLSFFIGSFLYQKINHKYLSIGCLFSGFLINHDIIYIDYNPLWIAGVGVIFKYGLKHILGIQSFGFMILGSYLSLSLCQDKHWIQTINVIALIPAYGLFSVALKYKKLNIKFLHHLNRWGLEIFCGHIILFRWLRYLLK